jgi:hypothetical protein
MYTHVLYDNIYSKKYLAALSMHTHERASWPIFGALLDVITITPS